MKKGTLITVLIVSAIFAITPCFATPMADISLSMNRVADYARPFSNGGGTIKIAHLRAARAGGLNEDNLDRVAALGRDSDAIDTPLEIALLASSAGVVNVAPVEAGALGTPKQTDLQLSALLMTEIATLGFLGNRNAVGIREGVLQHVIIARGNVTRAEIDAYYRGNNGIKALVGEIVDAEFSKPGRGMSESPIDIYAEWARRRFLVVNGSPVHGIELIKDTFTKFFLQPDPVSYEGVRGMIARVLSMDMSDPFYTAVDIALSNTLLSLSQELQVHIGSSWGGARGIYAAATKPDDDRFNIFSVPIGVGGGDF